MRTLTPMVSMKPQEEQSRTMVWKSQSGGFCTGVAIVTVIFTSFDLGSSSLLGSGTSRSYPPWASAWGLQTRAWNYIWPASSEFGAYCLCEQRRFRRACASAQSRQNLRCSLIQAVSQEEPSDRKPDPWPFWMAGHAQLKFVMTECSKTQIRLTRPICGFHSCSMEEKVENMDGDGMDGDITWAAPRQNR